MKYWDSSALVPLRLQQAQTKRVRHLLEEDDELVVCWGSAVECASAVAPGDAVREQAMRLLRVHALRAAAALQLAAAR